MCGDATHCSTKIECERDMNVRCDVILKGAFVAARGFYYNFAMRGSASHHVLFLF